MADIFDKKTRSRIMSKIRGRGTKIEVLLAKCLRKSELRFRQHPKMFANPDFLIFKGKKKALLFADGDFWHGHNFGKRKRTLPAYWKRKIARNMQRDKQYNAKLKRDGWKVFRVWETVILKNPAGVVKNVGELISARGSRRWTKQAGKK
jgi:DNA mismatch endonuclease Vsr